MLVGIGLTSTADVQRAQERFVLAHAWPLASRDDRARIRRAVRCHTGRAAASSVRGMSSPHDTPLAGELRDDALERFLRYVRIDTQSARESDDLPEHAEAARPLAPARRRAARARARGRELTEHGYVFATLPGVGRPDGRAARPRRHEPGRARRRRRAAGARELRRRRARGRALARDERAARRAHRARHRHLRRDDAARRRRQGRRRRDHGRGRLARRAPRGAARAARGSRSPSTRRSGTASTTSTSSTSAPTSPTRSTARSSARSRTRPSRRSS